MLRTAKPKNARSKRALEKKEPKVVEGVKEALFLKSTKTSQIVNDALSDLASLKKPHAVLFHKKNEIHPFQDDSPLQFFSQKNDTALFMVGSHSKKRPHTLTIGRTFDYQVLDMVELNLQSAKSFREFQTQGCGMGQKPLFLFSGDFFEQTEEGKTLKNLLLDFYRGQVLEQISLKGLEHVISVTADPLQPGHIYFRVYNVLLKKSATRYPRVELEEMGPRFDMKMGRVRLANGDVWKQAVKVSTTLKPKKVKNVVKDEMGDTFGRIHLGRQDLSKLQTRKMKGLKKRKGEQEQEPAAEDQESAHDMDMD